MPRTGWLRLVEMFLSGLKDGLSEKWDSIGDWFQDLPNKISNAIPDLFNTGKNAIQNFASGFGSVHIPLPHVPYPGINTT